ncbi:SDR family oxidoreductase [Myxococcus sp. AM009]|uniref:SDR family oxidoreductase n=1 Tax=unclassified Myxococcus TaxID=2648731 RepID=UPI0015959B12|nr:MULTISPECIES: SDR family oxidoreductase [unclassified Myxococcus]NVI98010.1 SDR family oxidoreductase [Myxococcus sp. AM009]NVJ15651.1 SDR family oxidoreductase [Myxococcus sp. AM010]
MILVTAATGKLGRLVVAGLLEKVPAKDIAIAVRDPSKASDLAARGVQVRQADYSKPETLGPAFAGVDKMLLISSSEVGQRAVQHQAVVDAAKEAGVRLLAYTSILRADTSGMALATEHKATEEAIRGSGLPFVFLRNGWYTENYTENLAPALAHGALIGSSGQGRIAAATRADYAAAAVAVLTGTGHEDKVYELAGDSAFTAAELAAEVSRQAGKTVVYKDLSQADHAGALIGVGVPAAFAEVLANSDAGAARGELNDSSGDLRRLIGRPTTPLADAVAAAVKR